MAAALEDFRFMSMLEIYFRGLLVAAGLLLPGAGWACAARWPMPWFAAGVISLLALFAGVAGFACLGVPINFVSLGGWLASVAVLGAISWRRRKSPGQVNEPARGEWWIALPVVPMLCVAVWRAVTQPLSGADVDFRWDHLAHLLVSSGTLDYYPPISPAAFVQYFWADGIAPLVSGMYAWTYLAAGSQEKIWTAIPVLLQVVGLLALVYALAQSWQPGTRAGWLACALVGATMLLQFAVNLGQETGLTALGVGGMALYLTHWQRTRDSSLLLPAAACAALSACAREYGIIFVLAGSCWVAIAERRAQSLLLFAGMASILPLGWHLRVWYLTGNPLYPHDLGGMFPINPVFHAWMQGYKADYGSLLAQGEGWRELGRLLVVSALPAVAGLAAGFMIWRGKPGWLGWVICTVAGAVAWMASVPYTAGGLFYSMRVLSPLLLLGCAWGGSVLGRWVPQRAPLAALLLGLGLCGLDASLRALTIPRNPYNTPSAEWMRAGYSYQEEFARDDVPFIRSLMPLLTGRVLSDSAGLQALFQQENKLLIPLWSPDVRFLFETERQDDAGALLRQRGYSHLLLKRSEYSVAFLRRTGVLQRLEGKIEAVTANGTYILFVLKSPAIVSRQP